MAKVKICGINDPGILQTLLERKVDYIGMIFAESKRRISPQVLQACAAEYENYRMVAPETRFVAVYLDHTLEDIVAAMEVFPFDILQLHGEETIGLCKKIKKLYPHVRIIKTLAVPATVVDGATLGQQLQAKVSYYRNTVDGFLLDTHKGNSRGGTGTPFAWEVAIPLIDNRFRDYEIGIAGGLSIDNVEELLSVVQPDFLDINSGVEIDGKKNIEKIDQLLARLEELSNEKQLQS